MPEHKRGPVQLGPNTNGPLLHIDMFEPVKKEYDVIQENNNKKIKISTPVIKQNETEKEKKAKNNLNNNNSETLDLGPAVIAPSPTLSNEKKDVIYNEETKVWECTICKKNFQKSPGRHGYKCPQTNIKISRETDKLLKSYMKEEPMKNERRTHENEISKNKDK